MEQENDYHVPDIDDLFHALHQSAKAEPNGGASGVARRMAIKPKTFLNYLDPDDVTHYPSLMQFLTAIQMLQDKTPVDIVCRMNGGVFKTHTKETAETIPTATLSAFSELTDVARLVEKYAPDGYDAKETSHILREIAEAERAMAIIKNTFIKEAKS